MKRKLVKITTLVISACLLAALALPIDASAAGELPDWAIEAGFYKGEENYTFYESDGLIYMVTGSRSYGDTWEPQMMDVHGYTGSPTDVTIPQTVTVGKYTLTVNAIDSGAFKGCTSLRSITINAPASSYFSLGTEAFSGCVNLQSVNISDNSISRIPQSTFYGCTSLRSFRVPAGVTAIDNFAFQGSGLTSIEISEGVTSIGNYAFSDCPSLTELTLPKSVTSLGTLGQRNATTQYVSYIRSVTLLSTDLSSFDYGNYQPLNTVFLVQPSATGYEKLAEEYIVRTTTQGMPNISITASPSSIDFGTISQYGNTPEPREVTLTNTGDVTVEFIMGYLDYTSLPETTGAFSRYPAFNVETFEPINMVPLEPGKSVTIKMIVNPAIQDYPGRYAGEKLFRTHQGASVSITLTADVVGATQGVYIEEGGTLDFGTVQEGYSKPQSQRVVIRNNSGGDVTLNNLKSNDNYDIGSYVTDLKDGGYSSVYISPKRGLAPGTYDETLTFYDGATVQLRFTVTGESGISLSPTSLDFGTVKEGYSQPAAKSVTIKNTGTSSITLRNSASTNFTISGVPSTLAAGGSATVTIRPKSGLKVGEYREAVTFSSSDGEATATISLSFKVTGEEKITITPTHVDFGTLQEGYSAPAARTVTIRNDGDSTITLNSPTTWNDSVTVNGQSVKYLRISDVGTKTLAPGASTSLTVSIIPGLTTVGSYSGRVNISGTAGGERFSYDAVVIFSITGDELYSDVSSSSWYYEAVKYVTDAGLMEGMDGGKFNPTGTATRAQVVTILYRLAGEPAVSGSTPFEDVSTSNWFYAQVKWASDNDIVNGVSDTTFSPNSPVTREQLAAMLHRYAAYRNYNLSGGAGLTGYADDDSVSSYAVEAMEWANGRGIITGTDGNRLDPKGNANRAQLATILQRFNENIVK